MLTAAMQALQRKQQYQYTYILLGLYLTCMLLTVCLANRLIAYKGIVLAGCVFVFPFTFGICDVLGEVYGYAYPRLFIWVGVFAQFIFSLVAIAVSHATAPGYLQTMSAYSTVFDPTLRYVISGLVAMLVGEFVNVYFLVKWKIIAGGKYFILRSLLSTVFGQACLTAIIGLLNYTGSMPVHDLAVMMLAGYVWTICFAVLIVFPAWLLVRWLKNLEKIDYYDADTNFNPFLLSLHQHENVSTSSAQ